jgi:hypothetical protein
MTVCSSIAARLVGRHIGTRPTSTSAVVSRPGPPDRPGQTRARPKPLHREILVSDYLDTFCDQGLVGAGGDRPVPVRQPSIRRVRYRIRLRRFFTVAASSVAVRTARLARLPFMVDQTFSTGLPA